MLQKIAQEERSKEDAEYVNRGLARDPGPSEGGGHERGGAKGQRIPVGTVDVNGERYEIGTKSMNLI
jgi:hypothetical protein